MKVPLRTLVSVLALLSGSFPSWSAGAQSVPAPQPAGSGSLACSPAPCVLPPTQASEGGGMVTDTPVAVNPVNQKELLLGSVDFNCSPSAVGFHLSRDTGSSWQRVLCMPFIHTKQFVYVPGGEPSVSYDSKGAAYASGIYFDNEGMGTGFLAVQKSTDGIHWGKPVVALRRPGDADIVMTGLAPDATLESPQVNTVYASGLADFLQHNQGMTQVLVAHSTSGGTSWTQAAVDSVQVYPEEDRNTRIAVGKDGKVYVTWLHCRGKNVEGGGLCPRVHVMISTCTDGGNTWSTPLDTLTVGMPHYWELPHTKDYPRVYNYAAIAADNSSGPYSGNVYVVMYDWTGSYLRVQAIRSTDGGKTWSQPVPLAPKTDTHDQFFPAISVSPTGVVGVSWLDRRNDPANHNYQAFAAFSTDGGKTFGKNWQLTKAFSDPDINGGTDWMGDYTGNTWAGGNFIAAWMDSSNGVDMQEVVGGVRLK
jgi:hypothetical protein